jgi:alpha-1,6-mannosyltransferase
MHLLDTTMFHAPEGGGVGRYLRAKRAWLRRHTSLRHTLLVPGPRDQDSGAGELSLRAPPLPRSGGYRFPLGVQRWARRIVAAAPDLIECGDPYAPAWAALNAGDALGVPVIAFCHSDVVRLAETRLGAPAGRAARAYVRNLYRRFDRVVAPSRYIAARLDGCGVRDVAIRPLGADTDVFHPSRARRELLRARLGLDPEVRLLVFAGRFAREKNLPVLQRAVQRLGPNYHLLLVGSGNPLRRSPQVTAWGYVSDAAALAALLASCDAFVHAGTQETFGLVVLEAMACGLPVACAPGGAVSELVAPDTGVVAARGDAAGMADAVGQLFAGNARRAGAHARAHVLRHHGWDDAMRGLVATYASVARIAVPVTPPVYAMR